MYILFPIIVLISCSQVACLKCYQCSSISNRGCFKYNLNSGHLKDCANTTISPVCRSISQVQYFTQGQDVAIVRECAYLYEEPLQCLQSKFSGLHYSLSCECRKDGCNTASNGCVNFILLVSLCLVSISGGSGIYFESKLLK